jgi:hypothetical protein
MLRAAAAAAAGTGGGRVDADEAAEVVEKGEMPLPIYLLTHGQARLTPEEKKALAQGLAASVASDPGKH